MNERTNGSLVFPRSVPITMGDAIRPCVQVRSIRRRKYAGYVEEENPMGWVNNIRMAPKLVASFALVALLAAFVGGVGLRNLGALHGTIDSITGDSVPSLQ